MAAQSFINRHSSEGVGGEADIDVEVEMEFDGSLGLPSAAAVVDCAEGLWTTLGPLRSARVRDGRFVVVSFMSLED